MRIKIHPSVSSYIPIHLSSNTQEGENKNKMVGWLLSESETPAAN